MPPGQLWREEVPRFDQADARERLRRVAVIRAVGVAFAGTPDAARLAEVRTWLLRLLKDPQEKIRRYAMAALPKIGAGQDAEHGVLGLLHGATGAREQKAAGRTLNRIGGVATLQAAVPLDPLTEQKVRARVAREATPASIRLDAPVPRIDGLRVHLRCRRGLEDILRQEAEKYISRHGGFRLADTRPGCVALLPQTSFTLGDLYRMRCFAGVGFALGLVRQPDADALARIIASRDSQLLLRELTQGTPRYRLDFVGRGHQRGLVRDVVARAYAWCPELLNDPRKAPWSIDIHETPAGTAVELRPRISPDPRMFYRTDDVDASSHPPLAACMARLAGEMKDETVWDPFCGAGLELIECALRGSVRRAFGSDLDPAALQIARANLAASKLQVPATFTACDFRDFSRIPGFQAGQVTLLISNPPMGRRIRLADPRGFFADFFAVAAAVLKPGGRLIFPNPLRLQPRDAALQLEYGKPVDLGGFTCRLEVWRRREASSPATRPAARRPEARPWYADVLRQHRRQARRPRKGPGRGA